LGLAVLALAVYVIAAALLKRVNRVHLCVRARALALVAPRTGFFLRAPAGVCWTKNNGCASLMGRRHDRHSSVCFCSCRETCSCLRRRLGARERAVGKGRGRPGRAGQGVGALAQQIVPGPGDGCSCGDQLCWPTPLGTTLITTPLTKHNFTQYFSTRHNSAQHNSTKHNSTQYNPTQHSFTHYNSTTSLTTPLHPNTRPLNNKLVTPVIYSNTYIKQYFHVNPSC